MHSRGRFTSVVGPESLVLLNDPNLIGHQVPHTEQSCPFQELVSPHWHSWYLGVFLIICRLSRFKSSTVCPTHIPSPGMWSHLLLINTFPCKRTICLGEWPYRSHLFHQTSSFLIYKGSWLQKLISPGPESHCDISSFIQKKLSSVSSSFIVRGWL